MNPAVTLGNWLAAAAPVLVLLVLVTTGVLRTRTACLVVAVLTAVVARVVFGAGGDVLLVALGKGAWLGAWILYVVFPAMLLYRLAERAGFDRIGGLVDHLFPNRSESLLVLAWLLPSFVQGVAGFGTPIAVAAPLLLASGWSRARAVAYPLIGYSWSVSFGSMGSSFYMAALTAHLTPDATREFAGHTSLLLGVNGIIGAALVLLLDGGIRALREGLVLLLTAGVTMAVTLYAVTSVVPAIGTVSAGAAGFVVALLMAWVSRRRHRARQASWAVPAGQPAAEPLPAEGPEPAAEAAPSRERAGWLISPYLYLLGVALVVLLVPVSRDFVDHHLVLAFDFPATTTSLGWTSPPVDDYTPLRLLAHPGSYLLLACLLGYLTYRAVGLWRPRPARELLRAWFDSVQSSAVSILSLACVTTMLIESGMVSVLARGAVRATGSAYPGLSALIGALGSFLTGSTTSSNALFSALQAESADLLGIAQPVLLAAQTAGANVGNSVAPVIVLIGIGAVGGGVRAPEVIKTVLLGTMVLLATVTAMTLALVTLTG